MIFRLSQKDCSLKDTVHTSAEQFQLEISIYAIKAVDLDLQLLDSTRKE